MAASFVHAPRVDAAGGSAAEAWLRGVWDVAAFGDGGAPDMAGADGGPHAVRDVALLFRNFRRVTGAAGAYFADPVAVVRFRDALPATVFAGPHALARGGDVLVPLGTPVWGDLGARNVLQQCAASWVSGGANTGDLCDEHVCTMYYAALQQLVFHAGSASTAGEQARWFPALLALTRAFGAVHAGCALVRKVTEALVVTPGADDMLQKAIAYVLYQEDLGTRAARLELLAVIVRRNWRHGVTVAGMAPGPFVVFTLVPLLRAALAGEGAPGAAELLARFNAGAAHLLEAFGRDRDATRRAAAAAAGAPAPRAAAARERDFRVRVLVSLTRAAGCALTPEQATRLLTHVETCRDMSEEPDWIAWGALPPPPPLPCELRLARFRMSSRDARAPGTFRAKVTTSTGAGAFTLRSYKGVEWAAVQLLTPGAYFIVAHDLGIATPARGDSRGEALTANWRVTVGDVVLPEARAGYSLAGMSRVPRGGGGGGGKAIAWEYRRDRDLALEESFVVLVTASHVEVRQSGASYFRAERHGEPALLAFKNMWMSVQYRAVSGAGAVPVAAAGDGEPRPAAGGGAASVEERGERAPASMRAELSGS